jgi:hypothetical protein
MYMNWTMEKSIVVGNAQLVNSKSGKKHFVSFKEEDGKILVTPIRSLVPTKLPKNVVAMIEKTVHEWTGESKKVLVQN